MKEPGCTAREEEEEDNNKHRCVLPWKPWSIDAPSIAKQIIFCVCSSRVFFPPCWYRCLVFVTLQPSQKLGRKTEPLKRTEVCGLRSVNGQEEGQRKLMAIQGGGWKWSCAFPGVSGRHSHCFVGKLGEENSVSLLTERN